MSNEQGTGGGLTISPPMAATSALAGPSPSHSSAGAAAAGGGCRVPLAAVASGRASPAFSRAAIFWVLSAEGILVGARERPEEGPEDGSSVNRQVGRCTCGPQLSDMRGSGGRGSSYRNHQTEDLVSKAETSSTGSVSLRLSWSRRVFTSKLQNSKRFLKWSAWSIKYSRKKSHYTNRL